MKIVIGFLRTVLRQSRRLVNTARHCARHNDGSEMAKLGKMSAALKRLLTGRSREHGVAIARQMGGQHGARQPVMRHDGKAMRLRLCQDGIGDHGADGRRGEVDPP